MAITDTEGHGISLLYVEDEQSSRELLGEIICHRYPDLRFYTAENGEAGMVSFERHQPEIVITDINMPGTDGIRMATKIKSLRPSTEIIFLTAYSNAQHLMQAIEIGISHYIIKPINVKQIFEVLDKVFAIIRSRRLIEQQHIMIQDLSIELAIKAADLELANQELESFNYTVAHDLRSPMVNISGFSQLLLGMHASTLDDVSKEYLQVIHSEMMRMNGLIGALLRFSVDSQRHIEKKWTDLTGIVNEITANLLAQEPRRQVEFRVAKGVKGYGDPDLLRVVLDNLLGNAWKYSVKEDVACIEFGTLNMENDLVYFVRDNGAGFSQEEVEKLFAPFQRLHFDDEIEGFGIGLATVQRIIRRHGGRIWADGEKGKGATFYFTL